MDLLIAPLAADDVPAVAAFHHRVITVAYAGIFPPEAPVPTPVELEAEWRAEPGPAWVARLGGGAIAGTVAVGDDHVRRLLVDPDRWRSGIGRALLDAAMAAIAAHHDAAHLWVLEDNDRARRFYEALGWSLVPGDVLVHGSGVREVRYRRRLLSA